MSIPIRVALSVIVSIVPSLNIGTAKADDTIEPPSHSAYTVQLIGADLISNPTFSIKIGDSLEDSIPVTRLPLKTTAKAPENTESYPTSSLQGIAQGLVSTTWDSSQVEAFDWIVNTESGWNPKAYNKSSTACGLGQQDPCRGLMDMSPEDQIKWVINYIKDRYGTPDIAKSWHLSHGWY